MKIGDKVIYKADKRLKNQIIYKLICFGDGENKDRCLLEYEKKHLEWCDIKDIEVI